MTDYNKLLKPVPRSLVIQARYRTHDQLKLEHTNVNQSPSVKAFNTWAEWMNKRNLKGPDAVAAIYRFVDKTVEHFVGEKSVCVKGCAFCCLGAIHISTIEAEYIRIKTGRKLTKPKKGGGLRMQQGPCTFLDIDKGACTIYEARPFVCRTYTNVENPKPCEKGDAFSIWGSPHLGYSSVVLKSLHEILMDGNDHINGVADIKEFFPKKGKNNG